MHRRGSHCGVTVGNGWLRNNPDIEYPEGHEFTTDEELKRAIQKPTEPDFMCLLPAHERDRILVAKGLTPDDIPDKFEVKRVKTTKNNLQGL